MIFTYLAVLWSILYIMFFSGYGEGIEDKEITIAIILPLIICFMIDTIKLLINAVGVFL